MKNMRLKTGTCLLLLGALLCTPSAWAKDYLIEVVLFETVSGRDMTAGGLYFPRMNRGLWLNTDDAANAGFLPVEDGLTLTDNAASIASSRRYRLLRHFAWRQPGLDSRNAKPVRISVGNRTTLYLPDDLKPYKDFIPAAMNASAERPREIRTTTVMGTIKVHLGRFLHMEANLVYTDPDTQQGFRLSQSRKMRSRELHYIDNPRFGILTRILPLEDTMGPAASE